MALQPYSTGTAAVVFGSTTVDGTGVAWLPSIVQQGDMLVVPAQNAFGIIESVDNTDSIITLYQPWSGVTISATVTISIASPGVIDWTNHNRQVGEGIQLATTGALPTGYAPATTYYVKTVVDDDHFTVAATVGGAAINTSGSQSGTQTATVVSLDYLILPSSWQRNDPSLTQAMTRQLLAYLSGAGIIYFVTGAAPDPGLGEDGQYALKTNTGAWQQWLKVSGSWVLQGTPIGTTFYGVYNSATAYPANAEVTWPATGPTSSYVSLSATTGVTPGTNGAIWALTAAAGVNGNTIWNGSGAPSSGTGANGDFYIDTVANTLYGPKAAGSWPSGVSLIGAAGTNGNTVRNGSGVPSSGLGVNGDFYFRTDTDAMYGPKTAGAWGSGTSLIGAAGSNGNTVQNGSGAPSSGLGNNGDFYYRTDTNAIYGPKTAGAWGSGTSLVGPTGPSGNTVLNGIGAPSNGLGNNGDFYYDPVARGIYGPKAAGAWPAVVSLVGATGATGITGATGLQGAAGMSVRSGSGAPASTLGNAGDFYIDTAAEEIYGPKDPSTGWPGSGVSLQGPQGIQGNTGTGLTPNASGTLANRATYDNQSPPFIYLETDVSPFLVFAKASNTSGDWVGPMPIGGTAPVGDLGSTSDSVLETFDLGLAA